MSSTLETSPGQKRLYKSTSFATGVVLPDGRILRFKFGKYATDVPDEIAYLDDQIARNGFGGRIYIDPQARTVDADAENPMKALREKIIAEYIAEQSAHLRPENDMGGTEGKASVKVASTSDIAAVVAGGDGSARLIPTVGKK